MLAFIEKMTRDPEGLEPDDLKPLHEVGLSNDAIRDAIRVCALFNMINRLADALDFDIPKDKLFKKAGKVMLGQGYKF